jgi:hypothetical protein
VWHTLWRRSGLTNPVKFSRPLPRFDWFAHLKKHLTYPDGYVLLVAYLDGCASGDDCISDFTVVSNRGVADLINQNSERLSVTNEAIVSISRHESAGFVKTYALFWDNFKEELTSPEVFLF